MKPEEKVERIQQLYEEAKKKLLELEKQQKEIIAQYIKELEQKKIETLKNDIINLS